VSSTGFQPVREAYRVGRTGWKPMLPGFSPASPDDFRVQSVKTDTATFGYGASTVTAITIGAVESSPLTNSMLATVSCGRCGASFRYRT
jgi:hypothetical protein